jgi:hypothetical protein
MTNAFGPEFEAKNKHLATVHWTWRNYRQLFATSEASFHLLNGWLPGFALILYSVLRDEVILGICRLSDSAKSRGRANPVFERLKASLVPAPDSAKMAWLEEQILKIKSASAPLKEHRNRRIAHIDWSHSLKRSDVLPEVTRQTIEDVLKLMRGVMNKGIIYFTNQERRLRMRGYKQKEPCNEPRPTDQTRRKPSP